MGFQKSQSSLETILLAGIIIAALIPLFYYISNQFGYIGESKISESLETTDASAETILSLGVGSSKTVEIFNPSGILGFSWSSDKRTLTLDYTKGEIFYTFPIDMLGLDVETGTTQEVIWPTTEGIHRLHLINYGEYIIVSECGNNVLEINEQCDGQANKLCKYAGQQPVCNKECTCYCEVDSDCPFGTCNEQTKSCESDGFCGDGILDPSEAEECDDGGLCVGGGNNGRACFSQQDCPSGVCTSQSNDGCNDECRKEFCGDGILQTKENCGESGAGVCSFGEVCDMQSCTCAPEPTCGNYVVEANEECDCDDPASPNCKLYPPDGMCDPGLFCAVSESSNECTCACESNAQCDYPNEVCNNEKCQPCTSSAQCYAGETCENGKCVPGVGSCSDMVAYWEFINPSLRPSVLASVSSFNGLFKNLDGDDDEWDMGGTVGYAGRVEIPTQEYIRISGDPPDSNVITQYGTNDFSVVLALKTSATSTNQIAVSCLTTMGASRKGWSINTINGKLQASIDGDNGAATLDSGVNVANSYWHKASFVRHGSELALYVDGTTVEQQTVDVGSLPLCIFTIGGFEEGGGVQNSFDGSIDEVAVFDRALDQATVYSLFGELGNKQHMCSQNPCGDGVCTPPETPTTCSQDCGSGLKCGNGVCDLGEKSCTCLADCQPTCGDTCWTPGEGCETNTNCPSGQICQGCECVPNSGTCQNGVCDPGENSCICVQDCEPQCGNGCPDPGEECGDSMRTCLTGEICVGCQCIPESGGVVCGNGILEIGEACEVGYDCGPELSCYDCQCVPDPEPMI